LLLVALPALLLKEVGQVVAVVLAEWLFIQVFLLRMVHMQ
tara:strand:- start:453 stop:572 length:120 start_codon:yes stop_codon:yes gene_type:complete